MNGSEVLDIGRDALYTLLMVGAPVMIVSLVVIMVLSAFINNTPTVVIFIPIMLALAKEMELSASRVMIPLSYASILGGTTVLIGSSTNLIVSGTLKTIGMEPLGMFDFAIPGVIIAAIGFAYVLLVLPKLLPNRAPLSSDLMGDEEKEFVIQLEIPVKSDLIGKALDDPDMLGVEGVSVRMLQRREHAYLPPFEEDLRIKPFDVLVLTATKQSLIKLVSQKDKKLFGRLSALNADLGKEHSAKAETLSVVEVLITPGSRMIGQSIEQIGFYQQYHCTVLGLQRRSRMITTRMTEGRLAAGDVLMVMGTRDRIEAMYGSKDMTLMDWSIRELPSRKLARRANLIFLTVVALAGMGVLPVFIGAVIGATAAIFSGCLTPIVMLITAGMAMATALQITGGAEFLARELIAALSGVSPVWVMSAMFGLMAVLTNVLSNNATALLFTPIAVSTANTLGVAPEMFIFAVIFACNCCSFASPLGYQTNLLVMAPGHYRFGDYVKAGVPLTIIVWISYTLYALLVYGNTPLLP
jgi:di/tricarboxylate transporter